MGKNNNDLDAPSDEIWLLVRGLLRKSIWDAFAQNANSDDPDRLAERLRAELIVLGERAGQADDAFRAMILDEIAAVLAERELR